MQKIGNQSLIGFNFAKSIELMQYLEIILIEIQKYMAIEYILKQQNNTKLERR